MMDDKLAWHDHIDYLMKRLNVRIYCFMKLNYFHVDKQILALFYESVIASVWRYCLLCWGWNICQGGRDRITRIVNQAGRMIGEPRQSLEDVYADLLITKQTDVMDDTSHPQHDQLKGQLISRSGRMCLPSAMTGQCLSSFVPQGHHFHWYVICFSIYIFVCIFVSFHYVHNFQKWNNKILLDLTCMKAALSYLLYYLCISAEHIFKSIFCSWAWSTNFTID